MLKSHNLGAKIAVALGIIEIQLIMRNADLR